LVYNVIPGEFGTISPFNGRDSIDSEEAQWGACSLIVPQILIVQRHALRRLPKLASDIAFDYDLDYSMSLN
jgi:hypothetical protein